MKCELCDLTNPGIIYYDSYCYSKVILEPIKEGHLLILPKRHVENLADLKPKESQAILNLLERLRKIISKVYKEDSIIVMNTGKYSSQKHLHFHILPSKGGLRHLFSKYENTPFKKEITVQELNRISDIFSKELEKIK